MFFALDGVVGRAHRRSFMCEVILEQGVSISQFKHYRIFFYLGICVVAFLWFGIKKFRKKRRADSEYESIVFVYLMLIPLWLAYYGYAFQPFIHFYDQLPVLDIGYE
jgi:hypothetical protein